MSVTNALNAQGLIPTGLVTSGLGDPGDVASITASTTAGSYLTATTVGTTVTLGPVFYQSAPIQYYNTTNVGPITSPATALVTFGQSVNPNPTLFSLTPNSVLIASTGIAGKYLITFLLCGQNDATISQFSACLLKNGTPIPFSGRSTTTSANYDCNNIGCSIIVSLVPNDEIKLQLQVTSGIVTVFNWTGTNPTPAQAGDPTGALLTLQLIDF